MTEKPKISPKAARINARISQLDAAKKLGISVSTLRNYENGTTVPHWDTVGKMSSLYCLDIDYIFFEKKTALSDKNKKAPL